MDCSTPGFRVLHHLSHSFLKLMSTACIHHIYSVHWWTFRLLPFLGYYKECCYCCTNMGVGESLQDLAFNSFGNIPQSGTARPYGTSKTQQDPMVLAPLSHVLCLPLSVENFSWRISLIRETRNAETKENSQRRKIIIMESLSTVKDSSFLLKDYRWYPEPYRVSCLIDTEIPGERS